MIKTLKQIITFLSNEFFLLYLNVLEQNYRRKRD